MFSHALLCYLSDEHAICVARQVKHLSFGRVLSIGEQAIKNKWNHLTFNK